MHLSRFLPLRLRRFRFVLSLFPGFAGPDRGTVFTGMARRGRGRRSRRRWCRSGLVVVTAVGVTRYTAGVSEAAVRLTTICPVLSIVVGVLVHDFPLDIGGTGYVRY